jgi:hypothetical protein
MTRHAALRSPSSPGAPPRRRLQVYEATGYRRHAEALAKRGGAFVEVAAGLSYQLAPRARIFRRDTAAANTLGSFGRLMRSNHYGGADPLAAASPWNALCGRGAWGRPGAAAVACPTAPAIRTGSEVSNALVPPHQQADVHDHSSMVRVASSPSAGDLDPDDPDVYGCYDAKVRI